MLPYVDSVQITHFTTTIFITSKNEHLKRITLRCQCILLRRKVASVNLSIRQCMHILYLLGANVNTCNSNTLAQEMGNLVRQITRFVKIKMTISLLTFNCWSWFPYWFLKQGIIIMRNENAPEVEVKINKWLSLGRI